MANRKKELSLALRYSPPIWAAIDRPMRALLSTIFGVEFNDDLVVRVACDTGVGSLRWSHGVYDYMLDLSTRRMFRRRRQDVSVDECIWVEVDYDT